MTLKFLVSLLNWLQARFEEEAETALKNANAFEERAKAMLAIAMEHRQNNALAVKLAGRIDDILAE